MNIIYTDNINNCIYDRVTCRIIKAHGNDPAVLYNLSEEEYQKIKSGTYYAIYGEDIPDSITFGCNERCNPEVAYVFFRTEKGIHPVRVTYSRKTLANFARQERKFGHLRPENEPDNF